MRKESVIRHAGNEGYLVAEAQTALGDDQVLAAGLFGWQDLVYAQIVGNTAGGAVGDLVGGDTGAAIGFVAGGRVAKEEWAAEHGMTLVLLGVMTPTHFKILNWDGDHAQDEVIAFDRGTTDVHISKFGLSRIVHLRDPANGAEIKLHAAAAPYMAQSKADKIVLHLLSAPEDT